MLSRFVRLKWEYFFCENAECKLECSLVTNLMFNQFKLHRWDDPDYLDLISHDISWCPCAIAPTTKKRWWGVWIWKCEGRFQNRKNWYILGLKPPPPPIMLVYINYHIFFIWNLSFLVSISYISCLVNDNWKTVMELIMENIKFGEWDLGIQVHSYLLKRDLGKAIFFSAS